jgi:ABC-2 type transport system permease protein
MDTCFYAANFGIFKVIFLHSDELGGWNEAQVMVFMSVYFVVDAINMIFISSGMWNFPKIVNKGELDYYLLRPVSTLFFLTFREINLASVINLFMALGILVWAVLRLTNDPGLNHHEASFWMLLLGILFGSFFLWAFQVLVTLPVFWTHSVEGLRGLFYNALILSERPDGIFTGWTRKTLSTVLPYSLIASFPARLFLDQNWQGSFIHLLVMVLLFSLVLRFGWQKGLRAYSSASS